MHTCTLQDSMFSNNEIDQCKKGNKLFIKKLQKNISFLNNLIMINKPSERICHQLVIT